MDMEEKRKYIRQPTGRTKGRFCKKNVADWKGQVQQLGLQNKGRKRMAEDDTDLTPPPTRRRVVELQKLGQDLWCHHCDKPLSLRHIIGEVQFGLASQLTIACQICRTQVRVDTCKTTSSLQPGDRHKKFDVNMKLSLAMLDAGVGPSQIGSIFSTVGIPPPSEPLIKRHERVVGKILEEQAQQSCEKAIAHEKQLTIASIPSLLPGPIPLKGSIDAAWTKRASGHAYNSLDGYSSLIGHLSGEVLGYATRSKNCDKCTRGHEKSDHDCRRNWSRSSKAMEPDMAVELVANNKLLKLQNCYIGVIIGDDDSSYVYAIQRASQFPVEKWSDVSHIKRNLSNALYSLKLNDQVMKYIKVGFATVLEQNRGEVEGTAAAIRNIVPHCFGDHTNCPNVGSGEWCRYHKDPLNYKHSGLPHGKPLSAPLLKSTLSNLMERYAKGAQKIAPGGSSQANESFNNIVCTKAPKYKYFGGSESFHFRVACAVLQKNEGTNYVQETMKKLCLSPGAETATIREDKDDRRRKRAALQKTVEVKKKRSQNKKKKNTSVAATDKREGITYSTGCDVEGVTRLLPNPSGTISKQPIIRDKTAVVFFDIEATSRSKLTAEIIQIAAKSGASEFSVFIPPSKKIPTVVTDLTGIHVEGGDMFYKGVPVPGVPARLALFQFLEFLSKLEADVILVAHNGMSYDFPILVRDLRSLNLIEEFTHIVKYFLDSLDILKRQLPSRVKAKESFKQVELALHFNISTENAHNALADVKILQEILKAAKINLDQDVLKQKPMSLHAFLKNEERLAMAPQNKQSLLCLQPDVSASMINKLGQNGISLDILKEAYNNGENAFRLLLGEDVDGKPRVTKHDKTVKNILAAVAKVCNSAN